MFAKAILILAACAFALGQKAPTAALLQAAKSPIELARFIDTNTGFEWAPLWNALGVVGATVLPCERPGDCSTELITVLDPRQTILVIDTQWDSEVFVRYFGSEQQGWRRSGAFGAWTKFYPKRHALTRVGQKTFLRVSSRGISGSGVGSEVEEWIDLTVPEFQPVFSFMPQGHQFRDDSITRDINASASVVQNALVETITVTTTIRYSGFDVSLNRSTYMETYQRRRGQKAFVRTGIELESGATVSAEEFDALTDFDAGPRDERLLAYALPGLTELAARKDPDAKQWLRTLLDRCKDTPEKRELMKRLEEH